MNGTPQQSPDVVEWWREWLSDILGVVAVLLVMLFLFSGCGGGTSGTGIRSDGSVLQGSVRTTEGEPVPGVVVTVIETNDQAVTNAEGGFEIVVEEPIGEFTVEFDGQGVDSQVTVSGVPEEATAVDVTLTVDSATGELSGTSVDITEEGALPTPQPSPVDLPLPDPSPTPYLSEEPTPAPDQLVERRSRPLQNRPAERGFQQGDRDLDRLAVLIQERIELDEFQRPELV